jgi:two-component system, chemotaxis family, sensor kinase Cph1
MAETELARGDADLTECAREPIHVPGAIQPHGVLLELRGHDLTIVRVSANAPDVLGLEFDHLLGRPLAQFVGTDQVRRLEEALRLGDVNATNPAAVNFLAAPDETFDAILQHGEGLTLLELEPRSLGVEGRGLGPMATLRGALARLQSAPSLEALYEAIVEEVRRLTQFDRVMVYRFDDDWNGQVIAEAKAKDLGTFLGLHYPASDIPPQARDLYTRSHVRLIPDASYQPAALLGGDDPSDPLDMSHCVLRSVSPVHLEYMRNMGVAASLCVSLLQGGRLWGLIACHHRSPRFLPYTTRQDCELLGQLASAQI